LLFAVLFLESTAELALTRASCPCQSVQTMASRETLADAWEERNLGATCIDDCISPSLFPKARWSEMAEEEELTNSGGDELCETCSGDTDDIVSVCSWRTDQGDWELPHGLESMSCPFSSATVIDDHRLPSQRSSSPSGSASEGTYERPEVSRCAQATIETGATSTPANSQMQFGYIPVLVSLAALSPAWSYGMVPEEEGAHRVAQHVQRCCRLEVARQRGDGKPAPAKQQAQKQRGKVRNKMPLGATKATISSACVPSQRQVSKRAVKKTYTGGKAQDESPEASTTIILRNFPVECTRDVLLDVMDAEGFSGAYNFVHMPVDFQTKISLGYALVNTVTHNAALCLWQHFQGFDRWPMGDRQPCEVAWNSPNQGLAAQIDRYRNSPLMHPSVPETYRPVLLQNGVRVDFPAPTSKIRPPRIRHQKQSVAEC